MYTLHGTTPTRERHTAQTIGVTGRGDDVRQDKTSASVRQLQIVSLEKSIKRCLNSRFISVRSDTRT